MTLGGVAAITEAGMQDLRSLLTAVLDLPEDYPEDAQVPWTPPASKAWPEQQDQPQEFTYYFDVAPHCGQAAPEVKFYLPTRSYGPDDRTIAHRLVDWMRARGRGEYGDRYLAMVEAIADHRDCGEGKGLHSYVTYQFGKKGVPDIKSYLCPEAFHPRRYPKSVQL